MRQALAVHYAAHILGPRRVVAEEAMAAEEPEVAVFGAGIARERLGHLVGVDEALGPGWTLSLSGGPS